jgi:hypothetical protein
MDSVLAEIRQVREEIAKRFNYDVHAIMEDIRKRQTTSGRKVVKLPPRPVRKTGESQNHQPIVTMDG